jgi:inosine-uridine nucleoside N-ribohydrolase
MITRREFGMLLAAAPARFSGSLVIDTDAGSDDLMAILFLLARREVKVEAITVVHGLAHTGAGAGNVLRLLERVGRKDIPVFVGASDPIERTAPFPQAWRDTADRMPGVKLPAMKRKPEGMKAVDYLHGRIMDAKRPFTLLALGPHTNVALALRKAGSHRKGLREIVFMGGAVWVPGNLGDGNYFLTENRTAEWNIFCDPQAAAEVLAGGVPLLMVPLDATNKVPIDRAFVDRFREEAKSPLAAPLKEIFASDKEVIDKGIFYAWDPLAAAILVAPNIATLRAAKIELRRASPEQGRTVETVGAKSNCRVAFDASGKAFEEVFFGAFRR